jgi:tetratricopeptide (TPR) repeat protein
MIAGWLTTVTSTAAIALLAVPMLQGPNIPPAGAAAAATLRARGLELGYNLDHADALQAFTDAIAADPAHPAAYRLVAATMWINVLFRQGAVTAEDFLGQAGASANPRPKASDLDSRFKGSLDKAIALAEGRLHDLGQNNADAHYQIGAAYGFLASYTATVEGSMLSAVGPSRRAYSEHSRVLELDPSRKDAGLIVGLYRYGVSELSFISRMFANLAGFGGGRERGIKLVEDAASQPSDIQTNARFAVIVIYNREKRYDEALRVIAELQRQYPRNRLLWLEYGSTALRAGRIGEAKNAIEQGLTKLAGDARPKAFGEVARWHYQHGLVLAALQQTEAANSELRASLTGDGLDWVRGRAHLELGRLAIDAARRHSTLAHGAPSGVEGRDAALEELRQAAGLCSAAKDAACLKDARDLTSRARKPR